MRDTKQSRNGKLEATGVSLFFRRTAPRCDDDEVEPGVSDGPVIPDAEPLLATRDVEVSVPPEDPSCGLSGLAEEVRQQAEAILVAARERAEAEISQARQQADTMIGEAVAAAVRLLREADEASARATDLLITVEAKAQEILHTAEGVAEEGRRQKALFVEQEPAPFSMSRQAEAGKDQSDADVEAKADSNAVWKFRVSESPIKTQARWNAVLLSVQARQHALGFDGNG